MFLDLDDYGDYVCNLEGIWYLICNLDALVQHHDYQVHPKTTKCTHVIARVKFVLYGHSW